VKTSRDFAKEIYIDVCERVKNDGYVAAGFIETYTGEIEGYVQSRIRAASNNCFNLTTRLRRLQVKQMLDRSIHHISLRLTRTIDQAIDFKELLWKRN